MQAVSSRAAGERIAASLVLPNRPSGTGKSRLLWRRAMPKPSRVYAFILPVVVLPNITDYMRTSSYCWAATIVLFAAAGSLGIPSSVHGEQPQAAAPAAAWEEKIIAEITLETDLKVTGGPDVLPSMPEDKRGNFASIRSWMAMAPDQSLAVGIGRLEMKPNVPIDLDGAIKGGIQQAVKKVGDDDPKFEIEVAKVSGLEGRKTTYVGSAPFRIESVVARDGQVVYQIQIFYTPARAADAQRILKSIKIAHAQ
jgi:hypothetical protein